MNYKVAAYITAYQDPISLQKCIKSIKSQSYAVSKIFIVDNSPDSILPNDSNDPNLIIEHYPENIGISGGLKRGIEWAINNHFDFLWTFDQDSQPSSEMLEKLIHYYDLLSKTKNNIGIIAPLPIDKITGQIWHGLIFDQYRFRENSPSDHQEFYECDAVITAGSLISIHAASQVDEPDERLFIDAVDWDYCMKFKQKGYSIIVAKNILLNHRFGESWQIKSYFLQQKITISNYSPLRYYYICRNHTFIETRLAKSNHKLFCSILQRLKSPMFIIAKIAIFEKPLSLLKIFACIKGTYDGFMGNLGKR